MEQFEHPLIGIKLDQRRHGGMAKLRVTVVDQLLEIGLVNAFADKRTNDLQRKLIVGQRTHCPNLRGTEVRQLFGHVEPAIAGQTSEQDLFKIERRLIAASADVTHWPITP